MRSSKPKRALFLQKNILMQFMKKFIFVTV